jgi:anaerobic magnesium-protoporphyrin IX monomethyl ester cyclase
MKILLTTINSKYIHQNLAIRLLFELNKKYKEISWKEFINKDDIEEIAAYCANYQLVAFSCYIWNITKILETSTKIKSLNPGCKILLGGPEVSFDWQELINLKEIDFIIIGEGEIPFTSFLNFYPDFEKIPALVWKKDGVVVENSASEFFNLQSLSEINPYSNEPAEELKRKICYIEASRGCPHCCEFCLAGLQNRIRYLPIEAIQSNLLFLIGNGRTIKFLDRTFNTNPKYAISIFKFIIDNYRPGNIFQFEIKADIVQNELIEFINNNVPKGIFRFEIGIQTLNAKSNKEIKRAQNFDNIKKFIESISDRIEIHLDLIVGLPYDYWDDIKYSFEEVFKLFAPELQLGFLKFLKGTPIRENYREHAYKFNKLPPYQIIESNYLTENEIIKILLIEQVLDIYWNKKRTLRTLKYIALNYSIFDFLLGLGKYFDEKTGFSKYDLNEIYINIHEFSKQYYPENIIIPQLISLDYYLQYKVKPKIRFLPELEKPMRTNIFKEYRLNHHKFRYIIHPINFKLDRYFNENVIEFSDDLLIVQYDGEKKATLVFKYLI